VARSTIAIEQLRLLPEDDLVRQLTARAEDQWFDRASSRIDSRDLGNLMVGFANAEGGLIVIGIHGGVVEGVNDAPKRINGWRQAALDHTEPPVRHQRIFEEMGRAGLPDPVYTQGPASLRVVLLGDPLAGRLVDRLPPGSERFVEFLARTGRVTTTQAVDLLDASRPTVLKHLHELAGQGLLEHVGSSLKDPRGFWRLSRGAA
jgi:predicted HTH transcriptional regulator